MIFSEKWGDTVDAAVEMALKDLKLTLDQVNVTVLEEPSRGFFGIGSKLALVRVEKKEAQASKPEKKVELSDVKDVKKIEKVEKKSVLKEKEEKKEAPKATIRKPVVEPVVDENMSPCENHAALDFLKEVTEQMGLELDISAKSSDECVYVDIQGKDSGTVIGKRGQTLDAIQYLTSLVVNKDNDNYVRVVVDAENYRSKREKTLEQLANRLADKVVKTRRSVRLEPMNPYERKVIHATLQNNPRVTTKSEGQDPYRRVIIELK